MQHKITLENQQVHYTVRKSKRARRMRLAVYCDGSVVVTTPQGLQETMIERFIREKSRWLLLKIAYFKQFEGRAITRYSAEEYQKHKERAHALALRRVRHFNKLYGLSFNQINIKNQKTRWGSCSRKGNLNFNYKIVFLPAKIRDYIIVHELCHLKEFNHSRRFWTLVARAVPKHGEVREELKTFGVSLQ